VADNRQHNHPGAVDRYWIVSGDQDIPNLHVDVWQAAGLEGDLPPDKCLLSRKRFPQNLLFANLT